MEDYRKKMYSERMASLNVPKSKASAKPKPPAAPAGPAAAAATATDSAVPPSAATVKPPPTAKNPEPNLQSVLQYEEKLPEGTKRVLAGNLTEALFPCRVLLKILLRFPLQLKVRNDFARQFTYSWTSFGSWMFFISGAIMVICGMLVALSLAGVMLNFPPQPTKSVKTKWILATRNAATNEATTVTKTQELIRLEEIFLLQRNFVPVLIALFALIHICSGDFSLFFNRDFVAQYFTFWDEAVEIMKIDAAKHPENVRTFMTRTTVFYCVMMITIIVLCLIRFAPISSGGPTEFFILLVRTFYPPIHTMINFRYVSLIGDFIYGFIIVTSNAYTLLFLYICKILINAFATWNERLEGVLHKGEVNKTREEHCESRTGFDHLFRDYVALLDLLRGADTMFSKVIETYYGTQVFSICLQLYYFARSLTAPEEFKFARRLDCILMGFLVFTSLCMLYLVSTLSAQVGEVAMDGLEIIRRKGFLGRKSIDEIYFTMSLYFSYTGHFTTALTGGRYVTFDRSFLVSLAGNAFSYFIILYQFTPPLAMLDKDKLSRFYPVDVIINVERTQQFDSGDYKVGYDTMYSHPNVSAIIS